MGGASVMHLEAVAIGRRSVALGVASALRPGRTADELACDLVGSPALRAASLRKLGAAPAA